MNKSSDGYVTAVAAYGLWGLFPLYWKELSHIPPLELLAHRIVWSFLFFMGFTVATKKLHLLRTSLKSVRLMIALLFAGFFISVNWLIFLYVISINQVLESSLAYFINPLINVLFGMIFYKERMNGMQWIAVILALIGVGVMIFHAGHVPWYALILALSFGIYGVIRKSAKADTIAASTIETLWISVPALFILIMSYRASVPLYLYDVKSDVLILLSGIVTGLPLYWFAVAARKLPLSTMGFIQYITPTLHFLLAVYLYHELFDSIRFVSFLFIWIGLLVYTIDLWMKNKKFMRPS